MAKQQKRTFHHFMRTAFASLPLWAQEFIDGVFNRLDRFSCCDLAIQFLVSSAKSALNAQILSE
jgi:hypothetical protein